MTLSLVFTLFPSGIEPRAVHYTTAAPSKKGIQSVMDSDSNESDKQILKRFSYTEKDNSKSNIQKVNQIWQKEIIFYQFIEN